MISGTTEWMLLIVAVITAFETVRRRVFLPIRRGWIAIKDFMIETLESNRIVSSQMKRNSGKTLLDKADAAAALAAKNAASIVEMDSKLDRLLLRDRCSRYDDPSNEQVTPPKQS